MKKVLCIILSFLLMSCTINCTVKAEEKDNEYESICKLAEDLLLRTNSISSGDHIYVGNPVYFYDTNENGILYKNNKYYLYPLYNENGDVILSYFIYEDCSKLSTMFNEILADYINGDSFVLILNKNQLNICTKDDSEITIDNKTINISESEIEKNTYSKGTVYQYTIDEHPRLTQVVIGLPEKKQYPYQNGCWAACMASMIQYYTGSTETVSTVRTTVGCSTDITKTIYQVADYLLYYYDIYAYTSSGSNSGSTVRSNINNGKAYMFAWQVTRHSSNGLYSYFGHLTICDGYKIDGNEYSYRIMDPCKKTNNTIADTYWIKTNSSSSLPTNANIYPGSGYIIDYGTVTNILVYNRYEPNRALETE